MATVDDDCRNRRKVLENEAKKKMKRKKIAIRRVRRGVEKRIEKVTIDNANLNLA